MPVPTRVLVTGGAGFIGSNVSEAFFAAGAHVTVFDNFSRPAPGPDWSAASRSSGRIVRGDIGGQLGASPSW